MTLAASPIRPLGHADAAIFETFVVPRYLSFFGERLVQRLVSGRDARVCHVRCRTGYPDRELLSRLPNAHIHGCDGSPYAIDLARAKAAALSGTSGVVFDYRLGDALPLSFPPGAFSHAFSIHPVAAPVARRQLLEELARIVAPRGQALLAMPLRGSFVEIIDLLRECALKHELGWLTKSVETAAGLRPTGESLQDELAEVGFEYVELDVETRTLRFPSGRAFFEDPVTRLLLLPEFRANLAVDGSVPPPESIDPFAYVEEAIDKYWSDGAFEMTVNVGVVTGRRAS